MSFRKFLKLIGIVLVVAAVASSTACGRSKARQTETRPRLRRS